MKAQRAFAFAGLVQHLVAESARRAANEINHCLAGSLNEDELFAATMTQLDHRLSTANDPFVALIVGVASFEQCAREVERLIRQCAYEAGGHLKAADLGRAWQLEMAAHHESAPNGLEPTQGWSRSPEVDRCGSVAVLASNHVH